jgi:hypothetical protein
MRSRSSSLAIALIAGACACAWPLRVWADEPPAAAADDPLEAQRERFRAGLERYRAGAFGDAILIWETIYGELGPEKGYRLAFNLARAYEQFGNSTRAAESFESYVKETERRRAAGEKLEAVVEKQEAEAKERLAELARTQGRIRIASERAVVVKIDGGAERLASRSGFIAYVAPDRGHVITFEPGTKDEQQVTVRVAMGELVELAPPAPKTEPGPPASKTQPPSPTPSRFEVREERPFGKVVLYVAAGVTLVSTVVPIVLYANALGTKSDHDAARQQGVTTGASGDLTAFDAAERAAETQKDDYEARRSAAYASIAIPAVLGAATLGLAAYWIFGAKETRVPVSAGLVPGGAAFSASAHF